jgi:hypothetical protein
LLDRLRIKDVDLQCKYLWVDVLVFEDYDDLADFFGQNDKPKTYGYCHSISHKDIPRKGGCIAKIGIVKGRALETTAMHESIHAAFAISRYRRRWPCDEMAANGREEFLASTAEHIFRNIQKHIRNKNLYR